MTSGQVLQSSACLCLNHSGTSHTVLCHGLQEAAPQAPTHSSNAVLKRVLHAARLHVCELELIVEVSQSYTREGTLSLCHTMKNSIGQWLVCVCNSKLVSCVYNSRKLKLCNSYERTFQARNYEWSVISRV